MTFSPVPHFESQIQTLWEDEEGTLWACTRGNGVFIVTRGYIRMGHYYIMQMIQTVYQVII